MEHLVLPLDWITIVWTFRLWVWMDGTIGIQPQQDDFLKHDQNCPPEKKTVASKVEVTPPFVCRGRAMKT